MKKFIVKEYNIDCRKENIPEGNITIAFLSDLHNVEIGPDNQTLLHAIESVNPDLILCGGDMIIGKPGRSVYTGRSLMQKLAARYPVYTGTGNHEFRTRIDADAYPHIYASYHEPLVRAGVHFLENEKAEVEICNIPLQIFGLEIPRQYYKRFQLGKKLPDREVERVFGKPSDEAISILLAHNPSYMNTYLNWGADLTLSGHFHGGVMRLFGTRGLVSPNMTIFPKYAYGLTKRENVYGIVSAGLGEHTIPVRLCNPRELVVIRISVHKP